MQQELDSLISMLKQHDKYYYFSDDYNVYRQGKESWSKINKLATELKLAGYEDEVKVIFAEYHK